MVLLMLCLHLNSFAQHISMQLKNVTVKQAIETIQSKMDIHLHLRQAI